MSCLLNPFMLAPAGTPYRYWRLTAADQSWGTSPSSYSWALWDLELFEAPDTTGADLTTGATASTNAGGAGSEGPERAIDGNLATSWTTPTAVGWWVYIQVDLGVGRVVRSLTLTARDLSLTGVAALPKSITLAGSNDGSNWTTVAMLATAPTHNVRQVYSNIMAGGTVAAAAVSGPLDLSNGAQALLVPAAGVSVITVPMLIGAGGEGTYHLANTSGGWGAALACAVPVSPGDLVTFVAGTGGTNAALAARYGGGGAGEATGGWGGGCSFVAVNGSAVAVAGGGGGGSGFAGYGGGNAGAGGWQGGPGGGQSTAANGISGGGGATSPGVGAGSSANGWRVGGGGGWLLGGDGGLYAAGGGGGAYGGGGGGYAGGAHGAGGGGNSRVVLPAVGTVYYGTANAHPTWDGDAGRGGYDPFADHSNERTPGGHGRIKASW